MPGKNVTVVHGGTELMNNTYPSKFRKVLLKTVTKMGVEVVLGDKIAPTVVPEGGYVTTENGKRIQADIVVSTPFLCSRFGIYCLKCRLTQLVAVPTVRTRFVVPIDYLLTRLPASIVRTLDPSVLTATGTVQVTPELRVRLASGAQNVWAIGDIIEWPEQKVCPPTFSPLHTKLTSSFQMVFKASMGHAPLVAKNVAASIKGAKTTPYGGKPEMIMVTLGPKGGRGSAPFFGGIVIGDWMASKAKSADLFVPKIRKSLGY